MKTHPRMRLDLSWRDLACGFTGALWRGDDNARVRDRIEHRWSTTGRAFVCLSVRTALDLYLAARAWPPGSEVLVTALNIPDMAKVIEAHGLVVVPVDLDPATLAPHSGVLDRLRTERTRAILVAHLFGGQTPLASVVEFAERHGLALIEDCAQAFVGRGFTGHAAAALALFSFGTIKTATALGGAIAIVGDPQVLAAMRRREQEYETASTLAFVRKLARAAVIQAIAGPRRFGGYVALLRALGRDLDTTVQKTVRGFPGADLLAQLRRRPPLALLRLLDRRSRQSHARRLQARAERATTLAAQLPPSIKLLGAALQHHSHWVVPVMAPNPGPLVQRLRAAGFDAHTRATLAVMSRTQPVTPTENKTPDMEQALARLVYLPVGNDMTPSELARLAQVAHASLRE
ncbi:MAG: DegT/DnrJ/EryC1/StrS family aminotransferase [Planctomycetota bacterium]